MQNKPGMTQSDFNRVQNVGFNYRVGDSEMKAKVVRYCISMIPAASCSYQSLLETAVLFCQWMSRSGSQASQLLTSGLPQKDPTILFSIWFLSILDYFSHSVHYHVVAYCYPVGQRQLCFHGTSSVHFMPSFVNHHRSQARGLWAASGTSSGANNSLPRCAAGRARALFPCLPNLTSEASEVFQNCATCVIANMLYSPNVPYCIGDNCLIATGEKMCR